jgi:predicted nucleic acid-binding protein
MNYTSDKFFVDTNLFVCAYDPSAGAKWKASTAILGALWDHQTGVISTQVLQELFVSLTQKVRNPVSQRTAKGMISDLLHWPTVINDAQIILGAIDLKGRYHFSFWDSFILQPALSAQADFLLFEDFQSGRRIESVSILNPFQG